MEPLPWLQFAPMQTPQLPQRPGFGELLGQLGVAAINRAQQPRKPGLGGPPTPKFQKPKTHERDKLGAPPPMARRRFPNPQQQQQLDAMRMD